MLAWSLYEAETLQISLGSRLNNFTGHCSNAGGNYEALALTWLAFACFLHTQVPKVIFSLQQQAQAHAQVVQVQARNGAQAQRFHGAHQPVSDNCAASVLWLLRLCMHIFGMQHSCQQQSSHSTAAAASAGLP